VSYQSVPYSNGGYIGSGEGESVTVKIEPGERIITKDGTVYELQACADGNGMHWVEVGKGFSAWTQWWKDAR
jgi:hypothetical protein